MAVCFVGSATELLLKLEMDLQHKEKGGIPHKKWITELHFDTAQFDFHAAKKWMELNGFSDRIRRAENMGSVLRFNVNEFMGVNGEDFMHLVEPGIMAKWRSVPYSYLG